MKKHLTFSLALFTIVCSTVTAQLPSYLPADGLMGWWPFNGNANDESGNGNDLTVNGGEFISDRDNNSTSAISLSSIGANITGTLASLNSSNVQTISYWFKLPQQFNYSTLNLLGNGVAYSYGFALFVDQNDAAYGINNYLLGYLLSNGQGVTFFSNQTELSDWNNLVCEYDGQEIRIYFNGLLKESFAFNGNINSVDDNIRIASWDNPSTPQNASRFIDDIAIYNRALTDQEIQDLYTGTNQTVDTGDGAAPLPQGIPYQAAARDAQGQVIADAPVNVRFSLHESAVDGAASYSETHSLTTNSIGLFNTVFGNGTPEQSAFDSINWAATTKFLQVEIDLGDGYVDMGTTQLLSVPYAFRSDEAARIKNAGLPIFADNAAALAGGLVAGEMYRTATGDLKVVF